jgi:uncharacterized protein
MKLLEFILKTKQLSGKSITNTIQLLQDGATIPFIARYRKELTNNLDEVQITDIRDCIKKHEECILRQKTICKAIEEQGKLTSELQENIQKTFDLTLLEDIYLPFKQKRVTRGEKAKKIGLEPLAKIIMSQKGGDPFQIASKYVRSEIENEEVAIQGAKDIIAEWMNENIQVRSRLRNLFNRKSTVTSRIMKGKMQEGEKFKDYFEFSEAITKIPSHRFLAIYRGEREGILSLKVQPEKDEAIEILERFFVKSNDACGQIIKDTCKEAYMRLLSSSLENELINEAKSKADKDAIRVFASNLKQLLLAAPLGAKRILAIDPGFRTGCKVVCLDEKGELLFNTTIFPHAPQNERDKASAKLGQIVQMYKIEAIAIGDGTAGRETENLIRKVKFDRDLNVYIVREDGASIYSASAIARKEFPDYDVTVRGAVSIGRRLMDPLSELVKIDPKSIGVGQYQHEVDQKTLKNSLDDVVISTVNKVGVDLNIASTYLLQYVSGLGPGLAENIVKYRNEVGLFNNREELKKVKLLGNKAFEQCAGFLRVTDGENPLDNSAVHPESYFLVQEIAKKTASNIFDLIGNEKLLKELKASDFPTADEFTFQDVLNELKKPTRDPRKKASVFEFNTTLKTIADIKAGMKIPGIVTNVTDFGAFVNVGIKENGLIHKSHLSESFVSDPSQFISIHEQVLVEVLEVDIERKRIGLKKLTN